MIVNSAEVLAERRRRLRATVRERGCDCVAETLPDVPTVKTSAPADFGRAFLNFQILLRLKPGGLLPCAGPTLTSIRFVAAIAENPPRTSD